MGCQKEKLYSDTEEDITELANLQLVKSNNPFVNEIVGSKTKSTVLNNKVEYEHPWLLDIEEDNKDRVIFCIEPDEDFIDRKMVYVKDGDHKFSYIIERAYVFSEAPSVEDIKTDSISTFTGILTIYTSEEIPVYSYFYMKDELVGETNFSEKINSTKSLKTAPIDGGMKDEVIVYGSKPNKSRSSSGRGVWFIKNGGRSKGFTTPSSRQQNKKISGGSNSKYVTIPQRSETFPRELQAKIELNYLRRMGDKDLVAIFKALLNDSSILEENKGIVYIAIHNAYNALKGEYMMSISLAYAEALKPLIDIALFNIGGKIAFQILEPVSKAGLISLRIPQTNTTVLGKYPRYIELAAKLNARKFNVPTEIWNKMSRTEQWAANVKFLNRTIIRGDKIILSNPVKNLNSVSGYYRKELEYFLKKGYRLSKDGTQLIK